MPARACLRHHPLTFACRFRARARYPYDGSGYTTDYAGYTFVMPRLPVPIGGYAVPVYWPAVGRVPLLPDYSYSTDDYQVT